MVSDTIKTDTATAHPHVLRVQAEIGQACRRHHVMRLTLFGSAIRRDWSEKWSDFDFVADFEEELAPQAKLGDYLDLKDELAQLLGRRVDLLMRSGLRKSHLIEEIDHTEVLIYGPPRHLVPYAAEKYPMSEQEHKRHRGEALLSDIDQACRSLTNWTAAKTLKDYQNDQMLQSAVERLFITIGEAINRLANADSELADKINDVKTIIAFRNLLVHNYELVADTAVWRVIKDDVPKLHEQVTRLMQSESES